MSRISPKPVVNQVVSTWTVIPGMTFSVADDIEGKTWIIQSCPVGTQFWTPEQAAELSCGVRTQPALMEAVQAAKEREALCRLPSLPSYDAELEAAVSSAPYTRQLRRRTEHGGDKLVNA